MTLRRLTLAFLSLFLIATIVTGTLTYNVTTRMIARLVDRRIASARDDIADGASDVATMSSRIGVFARRRETGDLGTALYNSHGRQIAGNIALATMPARGFSTLTMRDRIMGLTQGRALVSTARGGTTLVIVGETEPFDNFDAIRRHIFFGGFGAMLVIIITALVAFAALIKRRIAATRATAEAIGIGDLRNRIPVSRNNDEFDRQALSFNRMLDRIDVLMTGLRNVSNDIAHDLRTPLARLRASLTAIERETSESSTKLRAVAAGVQCDELLSVFAAILRIADIESGNRDDGFALLDLGSLTRDVGEMMIPVAQEQQRHLTIGRIDEATIRGDRQALTQALLNLIDNAVRHTPPGTAIRASVVAKPGVAILSVADTGQGIVLKDRATALRRFGRLDASRGSPGHGLGLSLVEAVASRHGGAIELDDAAPGLIVRLLLPVAARDGSRR